ncbi:MAG: beta-lactamase family protein [Alphaproteobacteria bacterium]|nr:beta-lactamase family protein [Alphaproteobacteria bacterium]
MTHGFSKQRLDLIAPFLQRAWIEPGWLPGAQVLVWRRGETVLDIVLGERDRVRATPMTHDTIHRIYSMTKPLTSVAALMLLEEGAIALDDPVAKFIPAFANLGVFAGGTPGSFITKPPARAMTVHDLMRHTSGFTYGFLQRTAIDAEYRRLRLAEFDLEGGLPEMVRLLATLPLEFSPGTAFNYSVSTDVLGHVIEIAGGMSLREFFQSRLLAPLGMTDTDFFVPEDKRARLATCYWSKDDRLALWDDGVKTMRYANLPSLLSGGGGLAGTAADYLRFARMLLNGGELDGVRYLSPKTVALMTMNHLPGNAEIADLMPASDLFNETAYRGVGFGLGVAVMQNLAHAAMPGSIGEYAWGGLAGTFFFVDPKEELIAIMMTQVIDTQARRMRLRRDLRTLIFSAMTESFQK